VAICWPLLGVTDRYEEDPDRRERFYYTMLGGGGSPPASACPEVARLVVQQHFNCPSVWSILPIQVWQYRQYNHNQQLCVDQAPGIPCFPCLCTGHSNESIANTATAVAAVAGVFVSVLLHLTAVACML
jgi:hypothetical protein